ncbi:MAG: hypothetical protein ACKO2L_22570, partial [Planctomycetaceae bacterium]
FCQKVKAIGLPPDRSYSQPHGGSLRAKGPADATADGPWQRAHLRCEMQPGASARPLVFPAAWRQPAGEGCCQRDCRRTQAARAPAVRNAAGGFRPTAGIPSRMAAACGQTDPANSPPTPPPGLQGAWYLKRD